MPVSARRTGLSVTVFTLDGTSLICELENVTLTIETQNEDARGVCDEYEHAWATSRSWSMEASCFVAAAGAFGLQQAAGDAVVAVVFNSGGNNYSGTALITSASHEVSRSGLQKWNVSLKGQGAITVTAP